VERFKFAKKPSDFAQKYVERQKKRAKPPKSHSLQKEIKKMLDSTRKLTPFEVEHHRDENGFWKYDEDKAKIWKWVKS